ncbi:S8 family serine peptidase [Clostridium perfringens]|uniref:S8 family serine peptidase n=1 Tax=Clostridium perfringens TaxID=1502 RepID=UPI001A2E2AC4|nr:S8 family serine peptidase [Clostridium perfringens]MBO3326987.1 S8 family serine peptidase [Clostridium perfringens]HAT4356332.1 S8 family serine peptidase [Clostridium perfringens]
MNIKNLKKKSKVTIAVLATTITLPSILVQASTLNREVTNSTINLNSSEVQSPKLNLTSDIINNIDKRFGEQLINSYKGQGKVIAIIDAGVDTNHKDFKLTDNSKIKWTKEEIENKMKLEGIKGKYLNEKIPFVRDYSDSDDNVINDSNSHGTHVAGIAAGNGEDFKGVAPEAQLLLMKVFSDGNNQGGSFDKITEAVNDAIKLSADSINISLGIQAGSESDIPEKLENALKLASEKGIVVNIAAGNDGYFGWGVSTPKADSPDYGVISAPSVSKYAFSVASREATEKSTPKLIMKDKFNKRNINKSFDYVEQNTKNIFERDKNFEYKEYKENLNSYKNKVVLINLSDLEDKDNKIEEINRRIKVVSDKLGKGIILVSSGNNLEKIESLQDSLPVIMINNKAGNEIKNENGNSYLKLESNSKENENLRNSKLSEFSSWGFSPQLGFKPEITAPGGNVLGPVNNNRYAYANGTSMSTPQITGAIALLNQSLSDSNEIEKCSGANKQKYLKNILMSTATPQIDNMTKAYSSPRKQGAGILNLNEALKCKSIIVDSKTDESKINLKEIKDNTFELNTKIINNYDKDINYDVELVVNTDEVKDGKITLHPKNLIKRNEASITVNKNSTINQNIKVDISKFDKELKELMPNGYYVEGFLILKDKSLNTPTISIPFVGFKGNWSDIPVIEKSIYETNNKPIYYEEKENNFTHFSGKVNGENIVLGEYDNTDSRTFDKSKIAISPNEDGQADELNVNFVALRNYKNLEINVYSDKEKNTKVFTNIEKDSIFGPSRPINGKKNFFGNLRGMNKVTTKSELSWDGKERNVKDETLNKESEGLDFDFDFDFDEGKKLEDGKYYFEIKVTPDVFDEKLKSKDEDKIQVYNTEVTLDTKKPQIKYAELKDAILKIAYEDEGSGIRSVKAYYTDKDGKEIDLKFSGDEITLPVNIDKDKIKIILEDWAFNKEEKTVADLEKEQFKDSFETIVNDYNLRKAILNELNKKHPNKKIEEITLTDLENIENIGTENSPVYGVKTLKGLENAKNLKKIYIKNSKIDDFSYIYNLNNLEELSIQNSKESTFFNNEKGIQNLRHLRKLNLQNNNINDISSLGNLKGLDYLNLSQNNISDARYILNRNVKKYDLSNQNITIEADKNILENPIKGADGNKSYRSIRIYNTENITFRNGKIYMKDVLKGNSYKTQFKSNNINGTITINMSNSYMEKALKNTIINIKDRNLRKEINKQLNKPENSNIYRKDLNKIKSLGTSEMPLMFVSSLDGLENSNIEALYLKETRVKDFSVLRKIKSLKTLSVTKTDGLSLDSISSIDHLENLIIKDNGLKNINSLANIKNLKKLDVSSNKIIDLSTFKNIENLDVTAKDQNVEFEPLKLEDENPIKNEKGEYIKINSNNPKFENGKLKIIKDGEIEKFKDSEYDKYIELNWNSSNNNFTGKIKIKLTKSLF